MNAMRKLGLRFGALIVMVSATLMVDGAPVHARRSTASIFAAVDTSKDGTVDEAEARQAASALFDRLDTDKDGTLDANELRGHISKEELQTNDPDHDGTLAKDEYLAIVDQRFKGADANHDGKLKIDEFTSALGAALVKLITYQVEGVHPSSHASFMRRIWLQATLRLSTMAHLDITHHFGAKLAKSPLRAPVRYRGYPENWSDERQLLASADHLREVLGSSASLALARNSAGAIETAFSGEPRRFTCSPRALLPGENGARIA